MARSSSTAVDRSLAAEPGGNAFDDKEPLAGAYQAQPPRLAGQGLRARGLGEPVLERTTLGLERAHVGRSLRQVVLRVQVALQGPRVEESQEHDRADRQPAQDEAGARGLA